MPAKSQCTKLAGAILSASILLRLADCAHCADRTLYVAPIALGNGSGSSAANAAAYTNMSFWGNVQTSLSNDNVSVRWLDGQYNSAGLALTAMGNPDHPLTLTGNTVSGAVLNAAVPVMLECYGCQNMVIKNLNFAAGPTKYQMVLHSLNPLGTWAEWLQNPSHKIVIDDCTFNSVTNTTGALGIAEGATDISVRNSTFANAEIGGNLHMIYNAYETSHVSIYNNTFTDCTGEYVRYRDHSDYGTIIGNTFKATDAAHSGTFIAMSNFNDVDPNNNPDNAPMELFATHYVIANNNFTYQASSAAQLARVPVLFYTQGYEPPGTDYLPTAADGAILTNTFPSNTAAKKTLLNTGIGVSTDNTGMGIDTNEVHYHSNVPTNVYRSAYFSANTGYGSVSQGWTGNADISATLNTTVPNTVPGSTRVNWAFASGEGWTNNSTASLQSAGWQFRVGTTSNANSYVNTTQTIGGATGVMYLGDSISSEALTADYKFQRLVTGSMQWRMGMAGAGSSFGLSEGRVNEKGLATLGIELVDSHTLRILSQSTTTIEESFSDVDFSSVLDWRLDWTSDPDGVNGLASLWVRDSSGAVHRVYVNRGFDSNVVPDTVWFATSNNAAVSNSIVLDSFTVMALAGLPTLAGDFNQDGIVDAADYVVWRQGGTVNTQNDYANWRANFGKSIFNVGAGSSLESAAVPEASLLALLSPYGFVLLFARRFARK